ncbi:hypothetical protein DFP72DRAFT_1057056 [Ephemerocybe angulata]|uniref:Uncharacterized protein n=1 Tax=Ephemerocybe angulata TaxID=980116 RepID=A0A8H6H7S4_9AGAR|nr:hypothetical protein DFP72DRAFT_1057056 [Tulosesus angulatus]
MSYYYEDGYGDYGSTGDYSGNYGSGGDSYGGGYSSGDAGGYSYDGGDQGGYSYNGGDQGSYTSAASEQDNYGYDVGPQQGEDDGYDTAEYNRESQAAAEYHDANTAGPFSDWQEYTNDAGAYANESEVGHDSEWDPVQTPESFQRNHGAIHFPSSQSTFAAPQAPQCHDPGPDTPFDDAHYSPAPVPALPTQWQDYHPMYWPDGLAESLGVSLSVAFSPFLGMADPLTSLAPSPPLEDGNFHPSDASSTSQAEPATLESPGAAVGMEDQEVTPLNHELPSHCPVELEDFPIIPAHDSEHPVDHHPVDVVAIPPPVPSPTIDDCPPPSLSAPLDLWTDPPQDSHPEERTPQHEHPPPTIFSLFARQSRPYRMKNGATSDWYSHWSRRRKQLRARPPPSRHPPNIQPRSRITQPPPHHNSRRQKGRIRTHQKRERTPPDPPKPSSQDPRVNALRRIAWKASRTRSL